ncbi:MAG TPA: MurR/RpiR family transcriptional regulator [Candidatus Baltobacteraceae bacterium]|jgi:DNA-binding MurR/RpiR family transcriptional regulator|nr:MurR/RpiR family transcriptional regulator [Candidatus Baltobacteraceae bacterium]
MNNTADTQIDPIKVPGCFVRIDSAFENLRPAEQRVAEFIRKNPEELILLTVTELAEQTKTSESTVVRLCQKIQYKGYQEFKIMLARDLVGPTETVYEDIKADDSLAKLKTKVFAANAQALKDTLEILSEDDLERAVEALAKARRIEIYGIGGSASLAQDAYHKFMKLGIPTIAMSDGDMMAMSSSLLTSDDVVIGISHTGASKNVCDAMERAQAAGATTICITHRATSPITKFSKISLFTAAKETAFGSGAMSSRIAQLSIIDTLFVGVAHRSEADYKTALERVQKTRRASASNRY